MADAAWHAGSSGPSGQLRVVAPGLGGMRPRVAPLRVMTVFGTRPELIKLAPVMWALEARPHDFASVHVFTEQHPTLAPTFIRDFRVRVDHKLPAPLPGLTINRTIARIVEGLDRVLEAEEPDLVLVQGDTTSAMAGALAAFNRHIAIGHVEAGLRTATPRNPFPEEMNRRLISRLAQFHFAATDGNVANLRREGVAEDRIARTGNPIIDALHWILRTTRPSTTLRELLDRIGDRRLLVLTTHRRENFGSVMKANLAVLRRFVLERPDIALVFPVHPNPAVRSAADEILTGTPNVLLVPPLAYADFIHLLTRAWLIVSDSGGIQEEAPSLGRPLLILRENTERPEAVACGAARLVGDAPDRLAAALEELAGDDSWARGMRRLDNPFGRGDSGVRIADAILSFAPDAPGINHLLEEAAP